MSISANDHLNKKGDADLENGPWKLSLDIPTYSAFMTYAKDRSLREKLYKVFVGRASQGEKNNSIWDMISFIPINISKQVSVYHAQLTQPTANKDILFKGNDGSALTALTLDMSAT